MKRNRKFFVDTVLKIRSIRMPLSHRALVKVAATVLVIAPTFVAAQECNHLQSASTPDIVSYLSGVADLKDADCIAFAIKQLGNQRYVPAAPILTRMLEFRWPVDARQKQRLFVREHDGATVYPAAAALEQIGLKALPAVLNAIENQNLSRRGIEVAVSVWMMVYKTQAPGGVMLLSNEASKPELAPTAKQRLIFAAHIASRDWCAPADREQCKAAAAIIYSPASASHGSFPEPVAK